MSSNLKGANAGKMRRMISRKSHSWWWDSHISPPNSKWLAENLQEMDICVKEMLKLIEEEGDSFAKKAEMYYQKRPELIAHVEDFYRMYRALAERYDNVTGELRKNVHSELKSQGSGSGSDFGSEPPSPSLPSFNRTPDSKPSIPKPNHRAAGFEFFLGSGGSSDRSRKGSDHSSSSSGSDSESDDSKDLSGDGDEISSEFHRRILELENELCIVKEKLSEHEKCGELVNANADLSSKISVLEDDLLAANEKLRISEAEIMNLLQKLSEHEKCEEFVNVQTDLSLKISVLEKDLLAGNEKLEASEAEIMSLQQKLKEKNLSSDAMGEELSHEHMVISKLETRVAELESEVLSLQQKLKEKNLSSEAMSAEISYENMLLSQLEARIVQLESEVRDNKQEIEKLNGVISSNNQAIKQYKTQLADASEKFLQEKSHLGTDISKLEGVIKELKEDTERISLEKLQLESCTLEQQHLIEESKAEISTLSQSNAFLGEKLIQLETEKAEACKEREEQIAELNLRVNSLEEKVSILLLERDQLVEQVNTLNIDIASRDRHLHQLHLEHVKLMKDIDEAKRVGEKLNERVKELEDEVVKQRVVISDGAEGKREAIRQLCFSLEHYRDGYHHLRQVLQGHNKRPHAVMAV